MPETLRIDPEFEAVIPPLTEYEFKQLTDNILAEGEVFTPIFTWNGFIVDGHHRYKIIQQHPEVVYRVLEKAFENRYEALSWICNNQLGRRNLSEDQKTVLIGKRYKAKKKSWGGKAFSEADRDEDTGRFVSKNTSRGQNDPSRDYQNRTAEKIAKEMGVSPKTVKRAEAFVDGLAIADEICPGIEREVMAGIINPTKQDVIAITKAPPEQRKEMVEGLRKPRDVRESQPKKKVTIRDIESMTAFLHDENKPPITTAEILELVELDVDSAIATFEINLKNCREAYTDTQYKRQLDHIISKLEKYIKKLRGRQKYE